MADQPTDGAKGATVAEGDADPASGRKNLALLAVLIIALVPIVVATARAIHRGWMPLGDNSLMYIRSADVLSRHPPLLGIWSFGSVTAKSIYNHPGPLLYDLFAVPTSLFGVQGLAVAAALVNGVSLVGIAVVGRRIGGPLLGTIAVAASAVLCWTMGSQLLFDAWTPNSLLLLFLLFLMLIWAASNGDLVAFPVAIGVGCVLLETNLSYGLLVLALWAWAVVGLGLSLRQRRARDPEAWPALRRRAVRMTVVASIVLVACWIQPLWEQLTGPGEGNLTRIVHGLPTIKNTLGLRKTIRLVGGVTSVPPLWLRPSMVRVYLILPSLALAAVCLLLPAALLAWGALFARRRHDGVVGTAVATTAVAMLISVVTASRSPVYGNNVQTYQTRFLWPLAAFLTIAVITVLVRSLVSARLAQPAMGCFAIVAVVFSMLNLPAAPASNRTHAPDWAIPIMADLNRQIGSLSNKGTLLVHWGEFEQFDYQFFITGLLAELRHRDVPFVVDVKFLIRSLGDQRRFTGHNADELVRVATGTRAEVVPSGSRRIAFHRGLDKEDQRELDALTGQISTYIRQGKLQLNANGDAFIKSQAKGRDSSSTEIPDPKELLGPSRSLLSLYTNDLLVLDRPWTARLFRYQALQAVSDERTVAIFAAPLGGPGVQSIPAPPRP